MSDKLELALQRFRLCVQATDKQSQRETDALAFQVPANHWPQAWQEARKGGIVDGVPTPPQPMLSIPKLDQTFQELDNQFNTAHLGVQVHALSEDADDDTAKVLQGLYRRIEVDSRAHLARKWAYQRAYKAGRGAYKVDKVWDTETGTPGDQKIVIKRLLFQSCAYFDPFAQEPDFSDMRYAFEVADLPWETYKDKYGDTGLAKMDTEALDGIQKDRPDWITGDGPARAIRVAGYWRLDLLKSERGPDTRKIWYSLINGYEEIETEVEWDGHYIPLIPVIGRELIPFDGERRWTGVIEPAMDGQRLFNVAASDVVEKVLSDTKPPWLMYDGQDEGHEREWALSGSRRLAVLKHTPVLGPDGRVLPPPVKNILGVNIQGSLELLQLAGGFIQDATTTVDQSRIEALAKKKVAHQTLAGLQEAGDSNRSDFLSTFADVSQTYEAKVVLDLMPPVYDRPGRVARVLNGQDKSQTVMLNAPHVMDPQTQRPTQVEAGTKGARHYDLKKGIYGVVASVGKGFQTQNQEHGDKLGNLFAADPQTIPAFLDLYLKANEFPAEAVERAGKMVPPALRDDKDQDPKQLQSQLAQMKQALDQCQQQLHAAGMMIETKAVENKAKVDVAKLQGLEAITLQRMRDATSIAVAQIAASTKIQLMQSESLNEATALGLEHRHDATQQAHDRAHELAMAVHTHGQALEAAQQAHEQGLAGAEQEHAQALEEGEQGHQQALEQGEQGQAHALEQGEQAAELAPDPSQGDGA